MGNKTAQDVRWRRQTPVTYTGSGTKQVVALSRGMVYREILLTLTCAPTLTAANNTLANALRGDEWGCVKRIDIIANGSDVLRSFTGAQLWWLNRNYYGINPRVLPTLGDGATANPTLTSTLMIPFWTPKSHTPLDTALNSAELSDLRLEITWGTFSDINSAATAWTANPTINVGSMESFGLDGPFNLARVFTQTAQPSGANSEYRVDIPVGPMYRGFLINTSTGGTDTEGLITNFKLVSGTTVFYDQSEDQVRDVQYMRNSLVIPFLRPTASGIGYTPRLKNNPQENERAWYAIELVTDGYTTEAIDSYGLSELYFSFNVSAAATIVVVPMQIIPRRS
jgi:hypothetical protein